MTKFESLLFIALLSAPQFCLAQSQDAPAPSDQPAAASAAAQKAKPAESEMLVQISRASDLTINIRTQLEGVDEKLKILEDPAPSLLGRIESRTELLLQQLTKLDKDALELARLEQEFRASLIADYQFTVVTPEQRMQYVTDGMVIYDAMVKGFSEGKLSRKIDALNFFDKLEDGFRGLTEYPKAQEIYYKNLEKLAEYWKKQMVAEDRKRSRLSATRLEQLKEREDKLLEELEEQLDEDLRSAMTERWIAPYKKSYSMLKSILTRAETVLRNRKEKERGSEKSGEGEIVALLEKVWADLDLIRETMCKGEHAEAMKMLTDNEPYRELLRLNRHVFPEKYRSPIVEQYGELRSELRSRQSKARSLENDLTRRITTLQNSVNHSESQIKAIYGEIDRAKENEERRKKLEADRKRIEEERRQAREEARRQRELDSGKKAS